MDLCLWPFLLGHHIAAQACAAWHELLHRSAIWVHWIFITSAVDTLPVIPSQWLPRRLSIVFCMLPYFSSQNEIVEGYKFSSAQCITSIWSTGIAIWELYTTAQLWSLKQFWFRAWHHSVNRPCQQIPTAFKGREDWGLRIVRQMECIQPSRFCFLHYISVNQLCFAVTLLDKFSSRSRPRAYFSTY